jgi:NitT/TauT family transport system substrate-binding protein
MTVEIAPVLLAVRNHYPDGTQVQLGGVVNLISADRKADLATNAETQALRQSVKRPDIRIVMTLVEGLYRIVARRSAGIEGIADLKGKRIATLRATSADYFLAKMLEREGLTASDVTVVEIIPLEDLVSAIETKQIDAVAIWEPFSENVLRALGTDAVALNGEGIYRELFNLNTTAGALADPATRKEIVSFMRAIIDANGEMNRNPAEAQAMVAKLSGYTLEKVVNSWPHHGFVASIPEDMLDVLVDEEVWLAAEEKRQPRSRAELAPLIDRSAYDEAKALPAAR